MSTSDVLGHARDDHASGVIAFHKHPSGDPEPSLDDLVFTRKLVEFGKVLGVTIVDHIILGSNRYISLEQRGKLGLSRGVVWPRVFHSCPAAFRTAMRDTWRMWNVDELFARTNPSCAALFYGSFSNLVEQGSASAIEGQGTMTFVRHRERYLGLTNDHVLSEVADERRDRVWHVALREHVPMPMRPITRTSKANPDAPFDLAIYELPPPFVDDVHRAGKQFLEAPEGLVLSEGDDAIAIGFPGHGRRIDGPLMVHGTILVAASCVQSGDRLIVLQHELPDESRTLPFGGMSGGPIFRVDGEGVSFAGLLNEGSGPNERESNDRTAWIWGFPITREILDRVLVA